MNEPSLHDQDHEAWSWKAHLADLEQEALEQIEDLERRAADARKRFRRRAAMPLMPVSNGFRIPC